MAPVEKSNLNGNKAVLVRNPPVRWSLCAKATHVHQEKTLKDLERLRIDPSKLHRTPGSGVVVGGYGEVWFGTLDNGSSKAKLVAVKVLRPGGTEDERVQIAYVS